MNYFVGIDIAKYDHYATVLDVNGNIITEPFTFTNDISGFNYLLSFLDNFDKDDIIFGTESTAYYAYNLNEFLTTNGFLLKVINPIQTCKLRSLNIRNAKNDSIDCVVVARALLNGFGRLHSTNNDIYIDIKNLTRTKHNLTSDISKLKIQLTSQVDLTFPKIAVFL